MSVGIKALGVEALGVEVRLTSHGLTLLFEAFALSLFPSMPVAHTAARLQVNSRQLWRRIEHDVGVARAQEKTNGVEVSFDRVHVIALVNETMDAVQRQEVRAVRAVRAVRLTTFRDRPAGMLDGRGDAYAEGINGMLQQVKRAARGFRTVKNFVAIAYLRMSKFKNLLQNPLSLRLSFVMMTPVASCQCYDNITIAV